MRRFDGTDAESAAARAPIAGTLAAPVIILRPRCDDGQARRCRYPGLVTVLLEVHEDEIRIISARRATRRERRRYGSGEER